MPIQGKNTYTQVERLKLLTSYEMQESWPTELSPVGLAQNKFELCIFVLPNMAQTR